MTTKLRASDQLQNKSIEDKHLKPGSMLDVMRLLESSGDSNITRDANGDISQINTRLQDGVDRIINITRSNGNIISVTISFNPAAITKTYNIVRDSNNNITSIDEV